MLYRVCKKRSEPGIDLSDGVYKWVIIKLKGCWSCSFVFLSLTFPLLPLQQHVLKGSFALY